MRERKSTQYWKPSARIPRSSIYRHHLDRPPLSFCQRFVVVADPVEALKFVDTLRPMTQISQDTNLEIVAHHHLQYQEQLSV